MKQQFDSMQKAGQGAMEAGMQSLEALTRGLQTLATESSEFAARSLEQGTAAIGKLAGARTMESFLAAQADLTRTHSEAMLAQASRVGEVCAATAKNVVAPIQAVTTRAVSVANAAA